MVQRSQRHPDGRRETRPTRYKRDVTRLRAFGPGILRSHAHRILVAHSVALARITCITRGSWRGGISENLAEGITAGIGRACRGRRFRPYAACPVDAALGLWVIDRRVCALATSIAGVRGAKVVVVAIRIRYAISATFIARRVQARVAFSPDRAGARVCHAFAFG